MEASFAITAEIERRPVFVALEDDCQEDRGDGDLAGELFEVEPLKFSSDEP